MECLQKNYTCQVYLCSWQALAAEYTHKETILNDKSFISINTTIVDKSEVYLHDKVALTLHM